MLMGTILDFERLTLKKKLKKILKKTKYKNIAYSNMDNLKYIDKSTLCKGRKKIKPMAIKMLNDDWITNSYTFKNSTPEFLLYKNKYILSCIDGTTLEIENTAENRNIFGKTKSQKGMKELARAGASMLYDPLNKKIIDAEIGKYPANEREMFKAHIKHAKEILPLDNNTQLLVISDRGYFSLDMLLFCLEEGINFLFRLQKNMFEKEFESIQNNDAIVSINLFEKAVVAHSSAKRTKLKSKLKELEISQVEVRLTKVLLDTGETEYLLSGIPIADVPYSEMKELYFKRWSIETTYNFLKNTLNIEKFSGITKDIIMQEFYAHALLSNVAYDFELDAQKLIISREKRKNLKWKYQVNRKEMIGTMSEYFLDILYEDDENEREKIIDCVMDEISRSVEAVRPTRSFKRNKLKRGGNKHNRNR